MLIKITTAGPCTLWQSIDQYVMRGPTGEHVLSRDVTDLKRMKAHWEGFCQNNGVTPEPATLYGWLLNFKREASRVAKAYSRQNKGHLAARELEIIAANTEGRVADPVFERLSTLTAGRLQSIIDELMLANPNATHVGLSMGWDLYDHLHAFTEGWDYDPSVETYEADVPAKFAPTVEQQVEARIARNAAK
jgi:hypothetical protein